MRINELDAIETKFKQTLNANGRQFTKSGGLFSYVTKLSTKSPKHITKKEIKPVRLCLHFTVGHLASDLYTLTNSTITVPFVVARSGEVYQLSEPGKEVGYHLGKSNTNSYSNTTESFQTIGIEIVNFGGLKLKPNTNILLDAYGKDFCTLTDTVHYTKLDKTFRGYNYFANYTELQYDALKLLIEDLCDKFSIPKTTVPIAKRFEVCVADAKNAGVSSHVNWRLDKSDLAPNFDWAKVGL